MPAFASQHDRVDRVGILWDGKWWILAAATLAAVAAGVIAALLPPTYRASTLVRVVAQVSGGSGQDVVLASNNFASQYAELVDSSPVVAAAAERLGVPPGEIGNALVGRDRLGRTSSASAPRPTSPGLRTPRRRCCSRLRRVMRGANRRQSLEYTRSVERQLGASDREI